MLPTFFNDTILFNCTISDLSDVDPTGGFEFVNTTDRLVILYNYLGINNLLHANTLIEGHPNIIQQGNTSEIICTSSGSSDTIKAIIGGISAAAIIGVIVSLCMFL